VSTLAIIPARGGSKRVPRKNLRPLGGKPLVVRSIEAGLAARSIDRLVVSSDSEEVLALARGIDPALCLERPAELSSDTSQAIEYVRHALATLEDATRRFKTIVILQPSSPFCRAEDIDGTLELLERSAADSAVSVVKVPHAIHPAKLKVMTGDRLLPYFEEELGRMAAHQLPEVYVRNCAVYASRRRVIDSGQVIGDDCRGYVMPPERSLDINDELDFEFAEFMLPRIPT